MNIDMVEALRQALHRNPEARDAIARDRLWAFVTSLLDEPELHAAAVHLAQSPSADLSRTISDVSGVAQSGSDVRKVIAKLYERAANWRVGNYRGKASMVKAPDDLCVASLEEFGLVLALLVEENVVEAIEAKIVPDWVAEVSDGGELTMSCASGIAVDAPALRVTRLPNREGFLDLVFDIPTSSLRRFEPQLEPAILNDSQTNEAFKVDVPLFELAEGTRPEVWTFLRTSALSVEVFQRSYRGSPRMACYSSVVVRLLPGSTPTGFVPRIRTAIRVGYVVTKPQVVDVTKVKQFALKADATEGFELLMEITDASQ